MYTSDLLVDGDDEEILHLPIVTRVTCYDIDNCAVPSQQKIVKDTANAVDKIEQNNMQRCQTPVLP